MFPLRRPHACNREKRSIMKVVNAYKGKQVRHRQSREREKKSGEVSVYIYVVVCMLTGQAGCRQMARIVVSYFR